jgi:hypothetical protein
MITIPGEEAPADPLADLRAEASLMDPGADFLLAPVRPDGEAPPCLLSEADTGAAEPSLTMTDSTADTRALKPTTKTGLQMRVTRQDLRHETPPSASSSGGNCLLLFPPVPVQRWPRPTLGSRESKGEAVGHREGFGGDNRRSPLGNGCGDRFFCPYTSKKSGQAPTKLTTITLA